MAYGDFKNLSKRTTADKVLPDLISLKTLVMMYIEKVKPWNVFDKKTVDGAFKNKIKRNKESPEELHKPVIIKIEKRKVHSSFIDSIWCADLADM